MRKQLFKTVFATAMACTVAAMPALTVFAEDVTERIYVDGESVTIDGDINMTLDSQPYRGAIYVTNGGELVVDGDVTLTTTEDFYLNKIDAYSGSTIRITGDCTNNTMDDNGVTAQSNGHSTVIIDGSVFSNDYGVQSTEGNIYVGGDIYSEYEGVYLYQYDADYDEKIVVEGTIHANSVGGIATGAYVSLNYGETVQDKMDQVGNIAVYAIDVPDDVPVFSAQRMTMANSYNLSEEEIAEMKQEAVDLLSAAVNYIIHTEGTDFSFSGDGLKTASDFGITDPNKNFTTTKYGETFIATVASNYLVEGNSSVAVEKISDGVYSIKLIDHKGGILLSATAISPDPTPGPNPDQPVVIIIPDSSQSSGSESQSSSSESSTASYSDIPAGAVTVSLARSSAPTAAAGAGPAVLGATREPSRSVAIRVGQLTGAQFKQTIINNINATPAGGMLRIETDKIACFDKAMLEAFAKKGNIDMEVVFPIGNQKMNVTIPAGYDVSKLLDKKGYCGFLNLLAVFGTETEE